MQISKINSFIIICSVILCGCSAEIENIKHNLADMQTRNLVMKLPDGTELHFNTNVVPRIDWDCKQIGNTIYYDWSAIQTEGAFHWGGPYSLLIEKSIPELNANKLKPNYANLHIPNTSSLSTNTSSLSKLSVDISSDNSATVTFYACKTINPDHDLGVTSHSDLNISIGK